MKALSSIFIALLVGMLFLTACSGSTNPPQATKAPAAATPPPAGYPAPDKQNPPAGYPAAGQTSQPNQPNAAAAYPPDGIILQIVKADGKVVPIEFKGLSALAKQQVTLDNKPQNVSKLTDALSLGGITAFNKVTVMAASGSLALTKDQVAQAYLDVQANGNVRLLVQGVPADKWLTGVNGLKVE
jgi:PBP1b-binding outer membrane lipoprotein LpoB